MKIEYHIILLHNYLDLHIYASRNVAIYFRDSLWKRTDKSEKWSTCLRCESIYLNLWLKLTSHVRSNHQPIFLFWCIKWPESCPKILQNDLSWGLFPQTFPHRMLLYSKVLTCMWSTSKATALQFDCLRQEINFMASTWPVTALCVCILHYLCIGSCIIIMQSHIHIQYNKHMSTRHWPGALNPNGYSLVKGNCLFQMNSAPPYGRHFLNWGWKWQPEFMSQQKAIEGTSINIPFGHAFHRGCRINLE